MAAISKPDGYTISQMPDAVYRVQIMQKTTYDSQSDFTYIIALSGYAFGVTVPADSPFKKWQDVVDYAKANPGKLNYAALGKGSPTQLFMARLMAADQARDFAQEPVYLLGAASGAGPRFGAHPHNSPKYAAANFGTLVPDLYAMAGVTADDIGVVQSYENFTGGVLMNVKSAQVIDISKMRADVDSLGFPESQLQYAGGGDCETVSRARNLVSCRRGADGGDVSVWAARVGM